MKEPLKGDRITTKSKFRLGYLKQFLATPIAYESRGGRSKEIYDTNKEYNRGAHFDSCCLCRVILTCASNPRSNEPQLPISAIRKRLEKHLGLQSCSGLSNSSCRPTSQRLLIPQADFIPLKAACTHEEGVPSPRAE